jgi:hypothetical protein
LGLVQIELLSNSRWHFFYREESSQKAAPEEKILDFRNSRESAEKLLSSLQEEAA